jgi:hypothetical protein
MAPAEKTESTTETVSRDRLASHHEGIVSGAGRSVASPVLGEDPDRSKLVTRGRACFASVGGWVVSQ